MNRVILVLVVILAVAGVVDSSYALQQHYAPPDTASCDINETVNCTAVNQSKYSEFLGVPVASMGIAGYVVMGALAVLSLARWPARWLTLDLLAVLAVGALAGSLYLTYIEFFILEAVCPLCVISLTLVTGIAVLSVVAALRERRLG